MMGIGARGGKKDRKITFRNLKRNKKKEEIIEEESKKKELKKQNVIKKQENIIQITKEEKEQKKEELIDLLEDAPTLEKKNGNMKESINKIKKDSIEVTYKFNHKEVEKQITQEKEVEKQITQEREIEKDLDFKKNSDTTKKDLPPIIEEKEENTFIPIYKDTKTVGKRNVEDNKKNVLQKEDKELNFLEKQIIQVLEDDINEKKFQLKKIDSEIYTLEKNIEDTVSQEEMVELEKEIEILMKLVEKIKRQIDSLEKTFDDKIPLTDTNNYLIYLVEEYKSRRKEEIEFKKVLKDNQKYSSLTDTMIEIEEKQKSLNEKLQEKKDEMMIDNERMEKLNDNVVDIEEMNDKIKNLMIDSNKALEEIKIKLEEEVPITEKVDYISKTMDHTLWQLFLLMAMFKRNLSMKNNAVNSISNLVILDMIMKMTTPTITKQVSYEYNVKDYEDMIRKAASDTNYLENIIDNNLDKIDSIRYTFMHNYRECSYLESYQNALDKLNRLEENIKERKNDVAKMKKEMEYQLEKNNAKVKRYTNQKVA